MTAVPENQKKNTWGGRREGAGRKPGPNSKISKVTTVVLTKDLVSKLHRLGGSKWVRQQIEQSPEKFKGSHANSVADLTSLEDFFRLKNGQSDNLSDVMIPNPDTTVFFQAADDLMQSSGIEKGDLLIVDRDETPALDSLVIVHGADGYSIRRYIKNISKDAINPSLYLDENSGWRILGRIAYVIKQFPLQ